MNYEKNPSFSFHPSNFILHTLGIMAIKTTAEQLEEVQTAITECLKAQSVGAGDKTILRATLASLNAREETLLKRYTEETAAASNKSPWNKVSFNDPV
jgi:hypothetical protein